LISRRLFLERSGMLAASLSLRRPSVYAEPVSPLDPGHLTPFVDPLPIPQRARSSEARPDPLHPGAMLPLYRMVMREFECKVHRDLPPTRMWGFYSAATGISSPGPVFETRSGEGLLVEWVNELPNRHLLPVDHTIHGAEADKPEVRTVVHLHGGKTPPESDGYPEHWYASGQSAICHYPNHQDAAMLFYHDHTMGINRLNIYAGLQGLFFIRDAVENALPLPRGRYEIPLVLYDRSFKSDGSLDYPVSDNPEAPWVPEVYGNAILANGKLFPYLAVDPCLYRFRVMNGSNARFFRLSFGNGLELSQIGSDQGLLAAPVAEKQVVLAPAERADILFDFRPYAGQTVLLQNESSEILQFRVADNGFANEIEPLRSLRPVPRLAAVRARRTRRLTLDERMQPRVTGKHRYALRPDEAMKSMGMLLNNTPWHMPVTERPVLNTIEIWELINLTEDSHPIHLHLVQFQILDRQLFDVSHYQKTKELRLLGSVLSVPPSEAGWKDTVRAEPGQVTRIIVPFEGFAGRYVWHCHILEHEDNDMMRPYDVIVEEQR
jgi:spore coat protein A, manganese oxidase